MFRNELEWYAPFFASLEQEGDVKLAAEMAKISRQRVYQRLEEDPGFQVRFDEVRRDYEEGQRVARKREAKAKIEEYEKRRQKAAQRKEERKEEFLEKLLETGRVMEACGACSVSYATFHRWAEADPGFKQKVQNVKDYLSGGSDD